MLATRRWFNSMPGVREYPGSALWFLEAFGFAEGSKATEGHEGNGHPSAASAWRRQYVAVKGFFNYIPDEGIIEVPSTSRRFRVGEFEMISAQDLKSRLFSHPNRQTQEFQNLSFTHAVRRSRDLHLDPANAGAVFQVDALCNCLQTPWFCTPDEGVTRYAREGSQGAASSIVCPGATVHRNYFVNVTGQGASGTQLDSLSGVSKVLENSENMYWHVENGWCRPLQTESIARLSKRLQADPELSRPCRDAVQVGVHWDTEVMSRSRHCVCQVHCSSLPVGIEKTVKVKHWKEFAQLVLQGSYEATLAAAAVLAAERGTRVRVFLTLLGCGSFGNRHYWVKNAIEAALECFRTEPLDVVLAHPQELPRDQRWFELECGRRPKDLLRKANHPTEPLEHELERDINAVRSRLSEIGTVSIGELPPAFRRLDINGDGMIDDKELQTVLLWNQSLVGKVAKAFASIDLNGDGVIDKGEFEVVLQNINPTFFTESTIGILIDEADADGDGEIHYTEFCSWLCDEDPSIVSRMLGAVF